MTVFAVYEDDYGLLGICDNRVSCVIDFLITNGKLHGYNTLTLKNEQNEWDERTIEQWFGPNWQTILKSMPKEEFLKIFKCGFDIIPYTVFGLANHI